MQWLDADYNVPVVKPVQRLTGADVDRLVARYGTKLAVSFILAATKAGAQ